MRAKVFCLKDKNDFRDSFTAEDDVLEASINKWLDALKDGKQIVDWRMTDRRIVFLYDDQSKPKGIVAKAAAKKARPQKKTAMCGQCGNRPPAEGLKSCNECRAYQSKYRKQQKKDKSGIYP